MCVCVSISIMDIITHTPPTHKHSLKHPTSSPHCQEIPLDAHSLQPFLWGQATKWSKIAWSANCAGLAKSAPSALPEPSGTHGRREGRTSTKKLIAYLGISWHILAYLDICKVSQYLSIFLNISQAPLPMMRYDVILCNAPAGPFPTNMLHCSNQVSNFVRRPLTTPKPWAHGLQVEVDLKILEEYWTCSTSQRFKDAAAHCSPAAHWRWEERRRCSKFCWDRRGSPSLVPACSLTVRLWTTPQRMSRIPIICHGWAHAQQNVEEWNGLVIGWPCSGIQQLEAPRCPKMSQDVPRCPKMSEVSSRVAIKTYSAIRSCSAGSRPRSFW